MKVKKIMHCHENSRVYQTLYIQETFKLQILEVFQHIMVHCSLIKISFSEIKFVKIFSNIDLWEIMLKKESGTFKWLVINDWKNIILV